MDKPPGDTSGREFKGAIKTVHRLDRQTSGVVFFAKTEKASDTFRKLMIDNKIKKTYFARVRGDFSKVQGLKDGEIHVKNMIYCVSNIDAFWECADVKDVPFEHKTKAKEAVTRFKFKFYDAASDTSVIKCFPETGRTHQIRVHLKHLGFPIANDQMYGAGDKLILNDGGEPIDEAHFKNSYQNDQQDGKKSFLVLWLHAYTYSIPAFMKEGNSDQASDEILKVKTKKPAWSL